MKSLFHITKRVLAIAVIIMLTNGAKAQIATDSIVADFNEFVRLMEETHPDPYTNYGGRPFFRKVAIETRQGLIQDKVTSANELAKRINEFLMPLHDGHSGIHTQNNMSMFNKTAAPIRFQAINDGVIVEAIAAEYKALIGSRLLAIENIPVKEICDGLAKYYPAENEIGRISNICQESGFLVDLSKVIPNMREDSLTYQIQTPDGQQMNLTLPLVGLMKLRNMEFVRPENSHLFPERNLSYAFVDEKKNTMFFQSNIMYDHDCLEMLRINDMGMDFNQLLQMAYSSFNNDKMPSDIDEAIAKTLSFSGEFEKMLQEMKKNNSKNLIIDLRNNGGGMYPITIPTFYLMWGDKYLIDQSNFEIENIRVLSPLLMKKFNYTLEDYRTGINAHLEMGDYIGFSDSSKPITEITEGMLNQFISSCMSSIKDKLTAQKGKPVYTPEHIYVLTSPKTFSAGFQYAFFLWKMGATIVGVPSSQAPNTYMEWTPFELPRTKLQGAISNTLQLYLPVGDPRAKQFTPDLTPTYEDYKRYNFDDNTIPLWLLDIINGKK